MERQCKDKIQEVQFINKGELKQWKRTNVISTFINSLQYQVIKHKDILTIKHSTGEIDIHKICNHSSHDRNQTVQYYENINQIIADSYKKLQLSNIYKSR